MSRRTKKSQKGQPSEAEDFTTLANLALQVVKLPPEDWKQSDRNLMGEILKTTGFFQKNLDSKVSFNDFIKLVQQYIKYESHPTGTFIISEGEYANKFYVVLKGQVRKYAARPIEEIEEEFYQGSKRDPNMQENKSGFGRKEPETPSNANNKPLPGNKGKPLKASLSIGLLRSSSKKDLNSPREDSLRSASRGGSAKRDGKRAQTLMPMNPKRSQRKEDTFKAEMEAKLSKIPSAKNIHLRTNINMVEPVKKEKEESDSEDEELDEEEEYFKARREKREQLKKKQEDEQLFKKIVEQAEEKRNKLFLGGVLTLKRVKEIGPSGYFGESFHRNLRPKDDTFIASEEVHLLTISREDYQNILRELIIRVKEKVDFFLSIFPDINKEYVTKFSYYFHENQYLKGEVIIKEGDPSSNLLLIRSGDVKLIKTVEVNQANPRNPKKVQNLMNLFVPTQKQEMKVVLHIANIGSGQFFGEEMLVKERSRLFEAIAGSKGAICYTIDLSIYNSIRTLFDEITRGLKEQAREKMSWRLDRLQNLLEQKELFDQKNIFADKYRQLFMQPRSLSPSGKKEKPASLDPVRENKKTDPIVHQGGLLNKQRITVRASPIHSPEVRKNLEFYKANFFRETFEHTVESEQEFQKKIKHPEIKDQFALMHMVRDMDRQKFLARKHLAESIIPETPVRVSKLPVIHAKTLSTTQELSSFLPTSVQTTDASTDQSHLKIHHLMKRQNLDTTDDISPNSLSPRSVFGSTYSKGTILDILTPRRIRADEEVRFKNTNGSYTIVNGRSKIRNILTHLEEANLEMTDLLTQRTLRSYPDEFMSPPKQQVQNKHLSPQVKERIRIKYRNLSHMGFTSPIKPIPKSVNQIIINKITFPEKII